MTWTTLHDQLKGTLPPDVRDRCLEIAAQIDDLSCEYQLLINAAVDDDDEDAAARLETDDYEGRITDLLIALSNESGMDYIDLRILYADTDYNTIVA